MADTRLLVMDDEEALLRTLKLILSISGFNLTTTQNGQDAVMLYKKAFEEKQPFAAVILDLKVPAGLMGGEAALKEILKIDPQAKAIASSGDSCDPVMEHFAAYGFCAAMVKPYDVEELKKTIKEVTDGKQTND